MYQQIYWTAIDLNVRFWHKADIQNLIYSILMNSDEIKNYLIQVKQIIKINHVGLRVRNLDITRAFYEQLGFEFIIGPIGPEPVAVMEHPSGININFILNASENASENNILMDIPEKHTGFTHISLEITDREQVEKQLAELKIPITETVELDDGTVFFFIRDPDGNVIEFHKPKPN
jgi:lactoylglutathione lyase